MIIPSITFDEFIARARVPVIDAEAPPPAAGPTPEQLQRLLALARGSALRYWSPATEAEEGAPAAAPSAV
jgi:hypothetical protein